MNDLPTPNTSHVPYERVYEPAEDSFLLLDTFSSHAESAWLRHRFAQTTPLVVEVGTGSGVVLGFLNAHAQAIFGRRGVLTAGVDVNAFACRATLATVRRAEGEHPATHGANLGSVMGDLAAPWRDGVVDVLVFNPPYVPTSEMPARPETFRHEVSAAQQQEAPSFDEDSYLLSLSYAGGRDGMETTERLLDALPTTLSPRGCAYILLCWGNKPDEVKQRVLGMGPEWRVESVSSSGKTAGREKLQVIRIWREG